MSTVSHTQMVEGLCPGENDWSSENGASESALQDSLTADSSKKHNLCLDMLPVSWGSSADDKHSEIAILVEVSREGGLILTGEPIPAGSILTIETDVRSYLASAISCEQDDFGYLVKFAADRSAPWFPEGYQPPDLLAA